MAIPDFRDDGRLPDGLHPASESEVNFRFGSATPRRRRLALRLRRWIALARAVHAKRFLVDGSFVTATPDPQDVDAVVWLEDDFSTRVSRGDVEAVELEMMLLTRQAIGLAADGGPSSRRLAADLDRLVGRGLATGISPHAPYTVAAPLAARLAREIARRRLPVAMHIAESRAESQLLRDSSGDFRVLLDEFAAWPQDASPRLFSAADWISRLARAPRGIVVHGTHLPDDESALARLARHRDRLAVVVCPRTTRALSGVLPPVAAFRAAGIRVAIGTDGRGSNPDLSVLAECRTLVDAGLARPAEALAMATRDAAWALLLERTSGRIAIGRPADLVVLRPARPHTDPAAAAIDPATRIVATLRGGRVIAGSLG
jgi:cytosine/adenosine deaminase-related metal-dependent hydrolase